ncbi:MAG: ribbon-helix-helix protein, CopG family [Deltaproteobacteria bacterium]|nr:ribbon-helix-helix protein, CopG family [Deltaproteobacteria bacterium]
MHSMGTVGVKLDTKIKKRLKSLAQLKDRSTHWMMRMAILEYLTREEEREKEKREDRKRWERYEAKGHFIANKDVSAWLDSIGTKKERPCPK